MKKIHFMDTSFRDGFQSCYGARVLTPDFLPALEASVEAGITHFEAGGGARFQSLFFYCGESAFDMMDAFRTTAGPDANLQTLARGISVVALSAQPRDIIELHAKMFAKHGMTTIRNFDALNDVRNLKYSGECIVKAGLRHEVTIAMMDLPPGCTGAHDADFYIKVLREILDADIPFDSVAFKDASGTANPSKIHDTIKKARKLLGDDVPISCHTHDTAGVGISQYLAAIHAGADQVDLGKSPVSGGTCQPDIISMWHALKGTGFTLDVDIDKILKAEEVLEECLREYFTPPEAKQVSSRTPLSPMPGGALTANTMMMRDMGTLHLYPEVIKAMSECVAKGGYGTSVTPVSQFYFQQAYANVTQGPWEKITPGYGKMVLGHFGRTPVPPDAEVVRLAAEQLKLSQTQGDPVDVLAPGIPKAAKILEDNNLPITDENIFIVASCESKGVDFLLGKAKVNVRKHAADKGGTSSKATARPGPAQGTATVNGGKPTASEIREYTVQVNGRTYQVSVGPAGSTQISPAGERHAPHSSQGSGQPAAQTLPPQANPGEPIHAKLPGNVLRVEKQAGDTVQENETLLVLEAMKMETPVKSPREGVVQSLAVKAGDTVESGALLAVLR